VTTFGVEVFLITAIAALAGTIAVLYRDYKALQKAFFREVTSLSKRLLHERELRLKEAKFFSAQLEDVVKRATYYLNRLNRG